MSETENTLFQEKPLTVWMTGLTAIGLFLIPLGHHPLQLAYIFMLVVFLLEQGVFGLNWQAGRVHHLLWPLLIYITVCLVGALSAGFTEGILSASRLRDHLIGMFFCLLLLDP